jgi:hypothetical protein
VWLLQVRAVLEKLQQQLLRHAWSYHCCEGLQQ